MQIRPFGYERVYLPLCEVADTTFHIQGNDYGRWGDLPASR